ncbi:MAG: HAMP domain-containing histidine kinase [Xanthomonadales bacterium]|nr:HAMP domain-containing histidine kinase [Xanthomonadales bacterium]
MPAKPTRSNLPGLPTRHNRRRLRTRIVLSFFLLGLGLTMLFAYATNEARARVENTLIEDALNNNIDEYARRWYAATDKNDVGVPYEQMRGLVVRKADFEKLKEQQPDWYPLADGIHNITGKNVDGSAFSYKLAVRKRPEEWFFFAYDTSRAARGEQKITYVLYESIAAFGFLSLLVGWWSASRVMRPVSDLVGLIRRRASGNGDNRALAPHFADDEVGELARALDDYSDRITDAARREREFNADVSHELRTPLAVIRSTVELMLEQPDLGDKMRERILRIQRAQEGGTAITETLLLLSRGERVRGETSVARVAEQLLEAQRLQQRRGKQLDLRMEGNTALMLDAPEATVNVALGNLIANAVRYTDSGSVTVHIGADSVDVIDTGRGLSAEDEARMMERGYRGDASGNTKGAGIGLAIVNRICALYGWQMQVQPRRDGTVGTVATLSFSDVR